MKRCPECRRDYYDDTLIYCLDDGNALLEGPASADGPATAILPEAIDSESLTKQQILTTDRQSPSLVTVNEQTEAESRPLDKPKIGIIAAGISIGVLLIAGGTFAIYKFGGKSIAVPGSPGFQQMKITKLTDTGKTGSVAMSTDGKYVVHSQTDGVKESL